MAKPHRNPVCVSIGILAAGEADDLRPALESVFRQSIFSRLDERRERVELWCVVQGGHERTVVAARAACAEAEQRWRLAEGASAHVVEIPEQGRAQAWNRFVHEFSAPEARYLCLVDARIALHHVDALFNLVAVLRQWPDVGASSGRARSIIAFKERKSVWERVALARNELAAAVGGALCPELYCLRASVARGLLLPAALRSEDVFVREAVITELMTRAPAPYRVQLVAEATHLDSPAVAPPAVLRERQRRIADRAAALALLAHLRTRSSADRGGLADAVRQAEARDAKWTEQLSAARARAARHCWQLCPGMLTAPFRVLHCKRGGWGCVSFFTACIAFAFEALAARRAHRALSQVAAAPTALAHPTLVAAPSAGAT